MKNDRTVRGRALLREYLREKHLTQVEFARLLNCKQSTISRMISGDIEPKIAILGQIEELSDGSVPILSWLEANPADTPTQPDATAPSQSEEDAA